MDITKIEETVKMIDNVSFSFPEKIRQLIAWYAYKTEDLELVENLMEELVDNPSEQEGILQKYFAVVDREAPWIEQIEFLLVSIEMIRLKKKEALKMVTEVLGDYYGLETTGRAQREKKVLQKM